MHFTLRPATDADRPWLRQFLRDHWGAEIMVTRGRVSQPAENLAIFADSGTDIIGVATYEFLGAECEVTSLITHYTGGGLGTQLLEQVVAAARAQGCRRVWLVTTNDNLNALKFYQKRGWRLVAVYPGAVDEARQLKPQIPVVGENDIPVHDELELELRLD